MLLKSARNTLLGYKRRHVLIARTCKVRVSSLHVVLHMFRARRWMVGWNSRRLRVNAHVRVRAPPHLGNLLRKVQCSSWTVAT